MITGPVPAPPQDKPPARATPAGQHASLSQTPTRPGVPVRCRDARLGVLHFPGPGQTARRLGTGLLREPMALSRRMSLASYDRLFLSQDILPAGGVGNLIAAPRSGPPGRTGRCSSWTWLSAQEVSHQGKEDTGPRLGSR
jgi:hypothetical protein